MFSCTSTGCGIRAPAAEHHRIATTQSATGGQRRHPADEPVRPRGTYSCLLDRRSPPDNPGEYAGCPPNSAAPPSGTRPRMSGPVERIRRTSADVTEGPVRRPVDLCAAPQGDYTRSSRASQPCSTTPARSCATGSPHPDVRQRRPRLHRGLRRRRTRPSASQRRLRD